MNWIQIGGITGLCLVLTVLGILVGRTLFWLSRLPPPEEDDWE